MKIDANSALGREIFAMRQQTMEKIAGKAAVLDAAAAKNETKVVSDAHRASGKVDALPEQTTDIERIREIGMSAYVEEVKAKKIEEIRERILKAMGLTEEMLTQLPPKQREQIEKIIELEIQKQLAIGNAVEDDEKKKSGELGYVPTQQGKIDVRTEIISRTTEIGSGIGVLLALQESDANNLETASGDDGEPNNAKQNEKDEK